MCGMTALSIRSMAAIEQPGRYLVCASRHLLEIYIRADLLHPSDYVAYRVKYILNVKPRHGERPSNYSWLKLGY